MIIEPPCAIREVIYKSTKLKALKLYFQDITIQFTKTTHAITNLYITVCILH